jgi:hypothetical protein
VVTGSATRCAEKGVTDQRGGKGFGRHELEPPREVFGKPPHRERAEGEPGGHCMAGETGRGAYRTRAQFRAAARRWHEEIAEPAEQAEHKRPVAAALAGNALELGGLICDYNAAATAASISSLRSIGPVPGSFVLP